MDTKEITAIDLFAGAGGFSLSAHNAGVQVISAVEFDPNACETYRQNIKGNYQPDIHLFEEDITQLDPNTMMEKVALDSGDLDILLGGPPCQGFSSQRILDSGVDDPRNKLLLRYFDFVKALKPKIFLVENVPGLLWKRHEVHLQRFKKLTKQNNYTLLGPIKINAKDFGVPQNRIRVFILGVRNDISTTGLNWPPSPTHSAPGQPGKDWLNASTVFERAPLKCLSKLKTLIGDEVVERLAFGDKIKPKKLDICSINMSHCEELIARFKGTPINGSREDSDYVLDCHKNYSGHKDTYGRIRLAQPGPTMTTGCTNPSKGRFLHPWKNHGISVRHAARFQTFPDNFMFSGGIISQSTQIGNAVPINLGRIMITELKNFLSKPEIKENTG